MNIETKYEIGNIVVHKYHDDKSYAKEVFSKQMTIIAYEVKDIDTNTCSAGTQVFYRLRPLHVTYNVINEKDQPERREYKSVELGFHKEGGVMGYTQFREDDLKFAPDDITKDVLSSLNK